MKKITLSILTVLLIFTSGISQAQHHCPGHMCKNEKIKAEKVAFITSKLNLNVEEAQQFWPIYNTFHEKKHQLISEHKEHMKKLRETDLSVLSDDELEDIADFELKHKEAMLKLEKAFHHDISKVLHIRKVILLYQTEMEFRRMLLQRLHRP